MATEPHPALDAAEAAALDPKLLAALNEIIDPCSAAAGVPAGLVDMGLVREATLMPLPDGGCKATVRISVTHPFCLMAAVFLGDVEKRVRALPGVREVASSVDSTVLWRPEMQSAAYRGRLAAHRARRHTEKTHD
jgi:metal-sulfur cluster biosynthetic enzyme